MRRLTKALALLLVILLFIPFTSCEKESTFSITFIDVGQGDAALVECDGHFMLIDGGPKSTNAEKKIKETLELKNVKSLDYLVISHFDDDHFGGLINVLDDSKENPPTIKKVLSNSKNGDSDHFNEFIDIIKKEITIPQKNKEYDLGSAKIKVIYVDTQFDKNNNSLVLLITYGKTNFLFTGDIDHIVEGRICEENGENFPITLLKVAHHGAAESTESRFLNATTPQYAVISVGANNQYKHPNDNVVADLKKYTKNHVYRTDQNGSITVISNGEKLNIKTEK